MKNREEIKELLKEREYRFTVFMMSVSMICLAILMGLAMYFHGLFRYSVFTRDDGRIRNIRNANALSSR